MILGEKIKKTIKKQGFSIENFANEIGISYQNLYNILSKEQINTGTLQKISNVLGVPMSYWFADDEVGGVVNSGNNNSIVGHNNNGSVNNSNIIIESKDKEVEYLKQIIAEKDKYIKLLEKNAEK